jgi:SAM-dependent methyltransferase
LGSQQLEVLDAGCGQGTQALALARLGHHVLGIDLSEELLELARRAASYETGEVRSRLRFAAADLLDLAGDLAGPCGEDSQHRSGRGQVIGRIATEIRTLVAVRAQPEMEGYHPV